MMTNTEGITTQSDFKVTVEKQEKDDHVEILLRTKNNRRCMLHWGFCHHMNGTWHVPHGLSWPEGTKIIDQTALQTPFLEYNGERQIIIRLDKNLNFSFIEFVFFYTEEGYWDNNHGKNYHIILPRPEGSLLSVGQVKITEGLNVLPFICGDDKNLAKDSNREALYAPLSNISFDNVQSSFGIALHMHQPTIPASTDNLPAAGLISNLQYMMEHQDIGDNHNAPVFLQCYSRISDIVRDLVSQGKNPRVMLDYSGNLLWGLRQMGEERVLENLKLITADKQYHRHVEWLGTMWSHSVVASTPVPDIKLHMMAWLHHFASIFGLEAMQRVKGFSPPEMQLPIHPDVCFEYVKALKECGYEWIMVQEHTIENLDGTGIRRPHFPHRLVAKNSLGEVEEISVLIKTQGSDTKLVAQMQPYYEAKSIVRQEYGGKEIPPYVLQIGDGENGGVMMNEFPPVYRQAFQEIGTQGVVGMNGSEYLEFIKQSGLEEKSFMPVQPVSQHRIWEEVKTFAPGACDEAINRIHEKDSGFNLDKASWTNDKNWVKGYEDVLDPMKQLSIAFHNKYDSVKVDKDSRSYREGLLYLLLSQTSCLRYWGEGIWTDYAKEICRQGFEALA